MENSVTFPSDPNPTQTGFRSGKRRKLKGTYTHVTAGMKKEAAQKISGFMASVG